MTSTLLIFLANAITMKRKVKIPTKNDVLCGRSGFGGIKFRHEGNMHFRFLIEKNKVRENHFLSLMIPSVCSPALLHKINFTGILCL